MVTHRLCPMYSSWKERRMQRSSLIRFAFALACLGAIGCTDEGVGDPCIPEAIPCTADGKVCGYKNNEAYLEASSVQCKSRLCLVYKLDNGTQMAVDSDPRVTCDPKNPVEGCVSDKNLNDSVYCTCRCGTGGSKTKQELCDCPDGFQCRQVLTTGDPGIVGEYCVKKDGPPA